MRSTLRYYSNDALLAWLALAVLNLTLVMLVIEKVWPPPHDFGMFQAAAQIYLQGRPAEIYNLDLQMQTEKQNYALPADEMPGRFLPYNHLPYELAPYFPIAKLPARQAFAIWRLENSVLLAVAVWLIASALRLRRHSAILYLIALAFFPVPYSFEAGQDTVLTLTLLAASLRFLQNGRHVLCGLALGLGLFKFQLVLPIVGIFFLHRYWRVVAGFATSALAALMLSILMVGGESMKSLLRLWVRGETGGIRVITPLSMPNIRGVLAGIPGLTPHAVFILTLIISVVLLLVAARQSRIALYPAEFFAIAVSFVVLVSYHTNLYDLGILALPILVLLESCSRKIKSNWFVVCVVMLLFCPPIYVAALHMFRLPWLAVLPALLWAALLLVKQQQAPVHELGGRMSKELPSANDSLATRVSGSPCHSIAVKVW